MADENDLDAFARIRIRELVAETAARGDYLYAHELWTLSDRLFAKTGLPGRAIRALQYAGYFVPQDALSADPAAVFDALRSERWGDKARYPANCGRVTLRQIREFLGLPNPELRQFSDFHLIAELRRRGYSVRKQSQHQ